MKRTIYCSCGWCSRKQIPFEEKGHVEILRDGTVCSFNPKTAADCGHVSFTFTTKTRKQFNKALKVSLNEKI